MIVAIQVRAQDSLGIKRGNCIRNFSREIGIKPQIGYLMAHHTQMIYLLEGHVKSVEIYCEKVVDGRKNWHHVYRLPTVGFSTYIGDLGNREYMGFALSILPYVKCHLIKRKIFEFNARLGTGLAYLTKSFDRIDNNKNSAIASPWNASLSINFEPEFKLKRMDVGLGISFIHFSNGAWKTPNLGFNIPSLSLNMGYKLNSRLPMCKKEAVLLTHEKSHNFEFSALAGLKEIVPANGKKYFYSAFNFLYRRNYHPKSNLLLFADVCYNGGYKQSYQNWYRTTVESSDAIRAGIGFGYGLSMDRTMFFLHNGFYIYDPLDYDGVYYHRLGCRYNFDNGLVINFSLKTHFAKADVVEVGAGYCFKRIKKSKNHD